MPRTICVINGHPDASPERFVAALTSTYECAAREAGASVRRIDVGSVPLDFLTNQAEFDAAPPEAIRECQQAILGADHLIIIYPLWLGTMPARLKAFLEQVGRGSFFLEQQGSGWPAKKMSGKSAHVVVTMGMPSIAYRVMFGAHSLRALQGGILRLAGFHPVGDTILGGVGSPARRARMLRRVAALARRSA